MVNKIYLLLRWNSNLTVFLFVKSSPDCPSVSPQAWDQPLGLADLGMLGWD